MKQPGKSANHETRSGRPRPIAAMLPKISAKAIGRRGFTQGTLLTDWPAIIGDELAKVSQPEKLTFPRGDRTGGTLHIRVSGGVATELQHLEPLVVERINAHFGYGAVARLRLVHAPLRRGGPAPRQRPAGPKTPITAQQQAMLTQLLDNVADERLRAALERLGTAVLQRENGHENL